MGKNGRVLSAAATPSSVARRVTVLGAGSWGTTFAKVLADGGSATTLWARRPEQAEALAARRMNVQYLPEVVLPAELAVTADAEAALADVEQLYVAVPSQAMREILRPLRPLLPPGAVVVSLVKGVEIGSRVRMSEVIAEELALPAERIAVLSGPNLSLEIAREQPTAAVVASADRETAAQVAKAATNRYFRSFVTTDVIGTEFGGVLKNLIAVAVGIADGVGYGENTKAAIITRGLVELTDFAVAFGARPETMVGLAGLGDLIATCESPLSRNNTAGRLLGQGLAFHEVIQQMNQTAEGISSVGPVLELAVERGVRMPIVTQVGEVLAGTLDPRDLAPHLATDSSEPEEE